MTTILKVIEDDLGVLRLETNLPLSISNTEKVELVAGLQFEMMCSLRGSKETAVYSAIFALGLASALLCEPMDKYLKQFEEDAAMAVKLTREGIREMSKEKGVKFYSSELEKMN